MYFLSEVEAGPYSILFTFDKITYEIISTPKNKYFPQKNFAASLIHKLSFKSRRASDSLENKKELLLISNFN